MLKRRSWVQFSGEQELDSAGTLEQANKRASRRKGTLRMAFGEGTIRGLEGGTSSAG
jgi:hypothetical protein